MLSLFSRDPVLQPKDLNRPGRRSPTCFDVNTGQKKKEKGRGGEREKEKDLLGLVGKNRIYYIGGII